MEFHKQSHPKGSTLDHSQSQAIHVYVMSSETKNGTNIKRTEITHTHTSDTYSNHGFNWDQEVHEEHNTHIIDIVDKEPESEDNITTDQSLTVLTFENSSYLQGSFDKLDTFNKDNNPGQIGTIESMFENEIGSPKLCFEEEDANTGFSSSSKVFSFI